MNQNVNYLAPVAEASVEARSNFIWKCYAHVVGAILAFAAASAYLYTSGVSARIASAMLENWWIVFGLFIVGGWGASHVAHRVQSTAAQYGALAFFVVLEALIFAPLLFIAATRFPGAIDAAAGVTLLLSGGLMATAMITRKDFSFLRGVLVYGFFIALALIIASMVFGFQLGTWFMVAMVGFAGIAVLYDTSNIMHHYPEDKYIAASLALFGSIALMFWYILQLFMSRD
ncbi:MAG: Bax inhibitor-1 family protein [Gammaproteobacteria bacterium]|nr:Bax inhibitor-1 family protein [Gammaproteobacteria bacterium]